MNLSRGGGVLLALRTHIPVTIVDLSQLRNDLDMIEIVGCKCFLNGTFLHIFVVYFCRTPSLNELLRFCEYFEDNFNTNENFLLLGDFNIPEFIINNDNILVNTLNNFCKFLNLE